MAASSSSHPPIEADKQLSDKTVDAESRDFVESVMGSQRAVRVETPANSNRKRHRSDPSYIDTHVKKARVNATARRSLYTSSDKDGDTVEIVDVDVETEEQNAPGSNVELMIKKLSADMHMMFSALTERVDKLESGLEQRISSKVAQLLDKRVNTELNRIKKDVENRLDDFKSSLREELASDLADINAKLNAVSAVTSAPAPAPLPAQPDRSLNVVIRGLPATNNENVKAKVNALFKDGLRLSDVNCTTAERKRAYNDSRPGVVIASFNSHDDKRRVMLKKKNLSGCRQFDKVFIDHDLSQHDRILSNNFRTILHALREQNLTVRGTRVVQINHNARDGSHSGERRQFERRDRDSVRAPAVHGDRVQTGAGGNRDRGDNWQSVRGYGQQGQQSNRGNHNGPRRFPHQRS